MDVEDGIKQKEGAKRMKLFNEYNEEIETAKDFPEDNFSEPFLIIDSTAPVQPKDSSITKIRGAANLNKEFKLLGLKIYAYKTSSGNIYFYELTTEERRGKGIIKKHKIPKKHELWIDKKNSLYKLEGYHVVHNNWVIPKNCSVKL
jgi:hypothetical protein